ncbi:MAG: metal-sensing transcriptional repressor [Chloroflexi bacterium]|nr:metal-sensing transcriptional repressor [Chloroflexota bacterium]
MDTPLQQDIQQRLRCVAGHIHGVSAMVGKDRPIADILLQTDAIEGSLRVIRRLLLETALDNVLQDLAGSPVETREHLRSTLVALLEHSGRNG